MYYFYLPSGTFDVTEFYENIIRKAIEKRGEDVKIVDKINLIPKYSKIFTDYDRYCADVLFKCRPKAVVNWFQGVNPEETYLIHRGTLFSWGRFLAHRCMERYIIKRTALNIFVSNAMLRHYRSVYDYRGNNYYIMPCFNTKLKRDVFNSKRYAEPKFVYIGSMSAWQCIDETLELFKMIKQALPEATLSIYTSDRDKAKSLCKDHSVDAKIDCVKSSELENVLKNYKYGFIVRDDSIINRVATPTKMSNYMGAGLIPVFSDSIEAYKDNITLGNPYAVSFKDKDEAVEKIIQLEKQEIDIDEIKKVYSGIFNSYWNEQYYIEQLSKVLP